MNHNNLGDPLTFFSFVTKYYKVNLQLQHSLHQVTVNLVLYLSISHKCTLCVYVVGHLIYLVYISSFYIYNSTGNAQYFVLEPNLISCKYLKYLDFLFS